MKKNTSIVPAVTQAVTVDYNFRAWLPKNVRESYIPTGNEDVDTFVYLGLALRYLRSREAVLMQRVNETASAARALGGRAKPATAKEVKALKDLARRREGALRDVQERREHAEAILRVAGSAARTDKARRKLTSGIEIAIVSAGRPLKANEIVRTLKKMNFLPEDLADPIRSVEIVASQTRTFEVSGPYGDRTIGLRAAGT
jgi:hypothetical protein